MPLKSTEEQNTLAEVMRSFVAKYASEIRIRKIVDSGECHDREAWQALSEQIGAPGLAVPEQYGGVGFGIGELAVILEQSGRALFPSPFLSSSVLATYAILGADDRALNEKLLPRLASGERLATVAVSDSGLDLADGGGSRAERTDEGWVISGVKEYVLDALTADVVIVSATTASGVTLFAVEVDSPGVTVQPRPGIDPTRSFGRLVLDRAPATMAGPDGAGGAVLERLSDIAVTALGCEQVGAASAVLDATVDYLKMRHQFGRPIGSFQALKHRCADLLVEVEQARSAVTYAVTALEQDSEDIAEAASTAGVVCSETFFHVASESIQMHGGIGFTWEHPAHLFFKRAELTRAMFGSPDSHRARLGRLIGITP